MATMQGDRHAHIRKPFGGSSKSFTRSWWGSCLISRLHSGSPMLRLNDVWQAAALCDQHMLQMVERTTHAELWSACHAEVRVHRTAEWILSDGKELTQILVGCWRQQSILLPCTRCQLPQGSCTAMFYQQAALLHHSSYVVATCALGQGPWLLTEAVVPKAQHQAEARALRRIRRFSFVNSRQHAQLYYTAGE